MGNEFLAFVEDAADLPAGREDDGAVEAFLGEGHLTECFEEFFAVGAGDGEPHILEDEAHQVLRDGVGRGE